MIVNKKYRNFALLLQGQFVTNLGNQIYDIAMLLWLKELTGSAAIMGLAMLLTNLPEAVLAPLGGKIADRYGRVRTMIFADLVAGLAVGMLLLVMLWRTSAMELVLALCITNIVLGISASCFIPAVSSLIPLLVPEKDLERGNAAHQFSGFGARAIGQGAGGLLFAALGAFASFAINAVSFVVSALTETFIREPRAQISAPSDAPEKSLLRETGAMLQLVWCKRNLRGLVLYIAAFHVCVSCLPVSLPFYAEHVMGVSDKWFGFFVGAFTLGILLGFIIAGFIRRPGSRLRLIAAISVIVGILFGLTGLTTVFAVAWMALLGVGAGIGIIIVNLYTELQLAAPEKERGGIMGAAHAISDATFPLGMALTGLVIEALRHQQLSYAVSIRAILIVAGAISIILGIAALTRNDH